MATQMTEAQAVNLMRNALLVAGEEMGKTGDHWPAIKSTVHSIMKDWENLQVERNVDAELKVHFGEIIARMEKDLEICPSDIRPQAEKIMKEIRESYEACFTDATMFVVCDEDMPIHIKRAGNIIKTLESGNDH